MTTQTTTQAQEQAQAQKLDAEQAQKLAAEQLIVARRNSNMRQATADQTVSLLDTLADFRLVFPTVSEVTEIVTANGGVKQSTGKETQNTTLLLYITMLGADTFNALFDSAKLSQADTLNLTALEINHKRARHAVSIYRAMITVDKYADVIPATAKFTRSK